MHWNRPFICRYWYIPLIDICRTYTFTLTNFLSRAAMSICFRAHNVLFWFYYGRLIWQANTVSWEFVVRTFCLDLWTGFVNDFLYKISVFNEVLFATAAYFVFKNFNCQLLFFLALGSFVKNRLLTCHINFCSWVVFFLRSTVCNLRFLAIGRIWLLSFFYLVEYSSWWWCCFSFHYLQLLDDLSYRSLICVLRKSLNSSMSSCS